MTPTKLFKLNLQKDKITDDQSKRRVNVRKILSLNEVINEPYSKVTIELKENEYIFHAGTKLENNEILASGGRVLNFVSISENFYNSRESTWDNLKYGLALSWFKSSLANNQINAIVVSLGLQFYYKPLDIK